MALCRLLLSEPDMLLLDEPTNHLDAESVAWLEHFLEEYPGTVIAVTHDRYFLDNVAGWILELDRGHGIPWEGNYSSWLEQKEQRLQLEEKRGRPARRRSRPSWSGCARTPRRARPRARRGSAASRNSSSQEFQTRNETNEIYIPPGPRLGDLVIEAKHLRKAFGDRLLFDDLTFSLPPGRHRRHHRPQRRRQDHAVPHADRAGKARRGEIRIGDTRAARLRRPDAAVAGRQENRLGGDLRRPGHHPQSASTRRRRAPTCGRFNFKGTDQQKLIGELSGGERNRVHLAKLLKTGGNVLLLDEPTNDLDVETLRALEEALLDFPGCAVVISHDRWFLDRIATHILAFEGDSQVVWFEGNYADYAADLRRRKGDDADKPHRIRYKPLTR